MALKEAMHFNSVIVLALCAYGVHSKGLDLPPYIKPCALRDPNFGKCAVEHGREAIQAFLKGDKKYTIPNLLPLVVPSVSLDTGRNLKIHLKDIHAYGLDRSDLQQVKFDDKERKLTIKLNIDVLSLIGKYDIDGNILILPITGKGDINFTVVDGVYEYVSGYTLKNKDGEDFMIIGENDHLDFKLGKAIFKLDNLFNGDEALGAHTNTFLNENWEDVINEIGGTISETVESVVKSIAGAVFRKVPYKYLFTDTRD